MVGFEYLDDPESYAVGSAATGWVSQTVIHAGQIKGERSDEEAFQKRMSNGFLGEIKSVLSTAKKAEEATSKLGSCCLAG